MIILYILWIIAVHFSINIYFSVLMQQAWMINPLPVKPVVENPIYYDIRKYNELIYTLYVQLI